MDLSSSLDVVVDGLHFNECLGWTQSRSVFRGCFPALVDSDLSKFMPPYLPVSSAAQFVIGHLCLRQPTTVKAVSMPRRRGLKLFLYRGIADSSASRSNIPTVCVGSGFQISQLYVWGLVFIPIHSCELDFILKSAHLFARVVDNSLCYFYPAALLGAAQ